MNNPNSPQAPPYGQEQPKTPSMANYQFNPDELRVLKECNRASFYERSIPIAGVLGAATYYATKAGFFTSGKYGAVPKVCAAVGMGYFIGKVSYQSKCAEMLMQLPNSPLGEMLRARKKGSFYSQLAPDQGFGGPGLSLPPFSSATDSYSDEGQRPRGPAGSSLDIDTTRPSNPGLDDVYRPNLDSTPSNYNFDDVQLPLEPLKPGVTYEELRRKNREAYQSSQPVPPSNPPAFRPPVQRPSEPQSAEELKRNKYGDIWTDTK